MELKNHDQNFSRASKKWFRSTSQEKKNLLDTSIINFFKDSGSTIDGFKEGIWVQYSFDTSIAIKINKTVFGRKSNKLFSYGLMMEKGNYLKGNREGTWIAYSSHKLNSPFEWQRKSLVEYKSGLKNGKEIIYNYYQGIDKDVPLIISHWENGIKNGFHEIYYGSSPYNLNKLFKANNGDLFLLETYYSNGNLESKFSDSIINQDSVSIERFYFDNGQLRKLLLFQNDTACCTWRTYYENGYIESILPFSGGTINGSYKIYHDNGQLWTERIYRQGKLMEIVSNFDRNGNAKDPGTLKNGTGILFNYDSKGSLIDKTEFIDGAQKGSR